MMTEQDFSALRRRFRAEKNAISHVRGCLVNGNKTIVSEFDQNLSTLSAQEAENLLGALKKVLSGKPGRHLLDIEFSTNQVTDSPEYALIAGLRSNSLKDKEQVKALYEKIISSLEIEGNFMILLASDRYDVFSYGKDGQKNEESESVFSYVVCAVCPCKPSKATLNYDVPAGCFHNVCAETALGKPLVGFLFPAFEEGGANIYNAVYYTSDLNNSREELSNALFASSLPLPAAEQKDCFEEVLLETVKEECNLFTVRSLQNQMLSVIEESKVEKWEEPAVIDKKGAGEMLRNCGVAEEKVESFESRFDEVFGEDAKVHLSNLADTKQMKIETPAATIHVRAGYDSAVETREIGGVKYILIRADEGATVNGVNIEI
jgi:hypothetical protein